MRRLRPPSSPNALSAFGSFIRLVLIVLLLARAPALAAQTVGGGPRFALVIGNGSYVELGKLKNPPNDAQDMAAALREIGFKVDLLVDADLAKMEDAVIRLGNNLSQSADSTGFFFYAGHGVQSGGVNYLIPADARIASETFLKTKALAAQSVLDTLQGARNALNLVVLDACRDNPFSWSRSSARGLSVVGSQPPGSIVAYATSAGSVAQDGTGRNGIFTAELLKQLRTPGLEIKEVFNRTGAAVQSASSGKQIPAVYNQFFGNAYLAGSRTPAAGPSATPSFGTVTAATGSLSVKLASPGTLSVGGLSASVPAGTVPVNDLPAGSHTVTVKYADGKTESFAVTVPGGGAASVSFTYVPAERIPGNSLRGESFVQGGIFRMGSESGDSDEKPVHSVTVSSFWMMSTEVVQREYSALMGTNPSRFKGDDLPVERVSWFDAVAYANKLSERDGLTPSYRISGTSVEWDRSADGWRLPTEAEWEYAARGGDKSRGHTYAGGNDLGKVGWFTDNTGGKFGNTHPAGKKAANELGLFDLSGNVWEWCWDWYGSYSGDAQYNPSGAVSETSRVIRGGSWNSGASNARSANRDHLPPDNRNIFQGFRLVRNP